MRLTYTDIKQQYLRNIGKGGTTASTDILADFNNNLGQRYQLIAAKMSDYTTQQTLTATTTAAQQYYGYPPGVISIDSTKIQIGTVWYPLTAIYSQHTWDMFNSMPIQPTTFPQCIFATKDDFGIWPIPQDAYTISFAGFARDRNLTIEDYLNGTIQIDSGSSIIHGTGTAFTPAMVGRWFTITDPTVNGQGYWYRIGDYVSGTQLNMEQVFQGPTNTGQVTYRIGESPEIPEEGHSILIDGATSDFYAGLKADGVQATWFNNKFWTGDGNNNQRDTGDENIAGGLIGLMNRYASRDKKRLIQKQPQSQSPSNKFWSYRIS